MWVANRDDNTVQAIDPMMGTMGAPIRVGDSPEALAYAGLRLWVANCGVDTVQYILVYKRAKK